MNAFRKHFVAIAASFLLSVSLAYAQASEDIAVTKTGPAVAPQGTNVSYDVTIRNLGSIAASGVSLTDAIPAGLTFVSANQWGGPTFTCVTPSPGSPGTITCTIATLNAGATASFQFQLYVPPATPIGTITNTATGASTPPDANTGNDSGSASTDVIAATADIIVTKTGSTTANPGTDVAYDVTIYNGGPANASNVSLIDNIPAGMTFVSASQPTGLPFTCTTPALGSGGTINCTRLSLLAGEGATFTFVLNIPADTPPGTSFTNVAVGNASEEDGNEENDSGIVVTSTPPPPTSDLGIIKIGPPNAGPNTDVTYTITVTNGGPDAAADVSWTDILPGTLEFQSLNQDNGPNMGCTTPAAGVNGTVNCTLAAFPAFTTATFTLLVHVPIGTPSGTTYQNTATVTSKTADPNAENNSSTTNLTVSASDLAITKTGPATANAGTNATYVVTVQNLGPNAAVDALWTDPAPPGTTIVSVNQTSGNNAVCAFNSASVSCGWPVLASGPAATFDVVLNTGSAATINNTVTATASSYDTDWANNTSTATTSVTQSADLAVTKSGPASVTAGLTATFTVTATNNGPSNAANATVSDPAPANATFVSVSQTGGPAFNCVGSNCTIASFATGAVATFDYVFAVNANATGSLTNTATISSTTTDPTPGNNSATATPAITTSADLSVTKTGPATVIAGTNVTYTVTATNNGPSNAANATVTDNPPTNTTFVSVTQTGGPAFTCVGSNCTIASFPAGAVATFDYVFAVNAVATGTLTNTATISSPTTDPTPANGSASTPAVINPGPTDMAITKTAGGGPFVQGGNATYSLVVTNNGPGTAAAVTVTDPLPAGMTLLSATSTQGTCTGTTTVTCNIGILAPAASATITLAVRLPQTPGPLSNTATVSAANTESAPANNSSTATFDVTAAIPTASEWGLLLMAMVLAGVAVLTLRR